MSQCLQPANDVITDLFEKEWHTETTVEPDDEGYAYFKGFYGDYTATVNGKEQIISAVKAIQTYPNGTKRIELQL